jgi:hypothetical protein
MVTKGPEEIASGMRSNGRRRRVQLARGARRGHYCPAVAGRPDCGTARLSSCLEAESELQRQKIARQAAPGRGG